MELRVEYTYDPESRNWTFVVPTLGIVGGAETREEAETRAVEAVIFTLEDSESGSMPGAIAADVGFLHLTVKR